MITLFGIDDKLVDAWHAAFQGCDDVSVVHCALETLASHDALVTAGNSYGIMNGGIDLAVRKFFGIEIQDAIQWGIVQHYGGFLPIGANLCVDTGNEQFAYLIYAPTMVTPRQSVPCDVYAVFYSLLQTMGSFKTVACCGLGSGVGDVQPETVAEQMRNAYDAYHLQKKR